MSFFISEFLCSVVTDRPTIEECGNTVRETVHADLPDAADRASTSMQAANSELSVSNEATTVPFADSGLPADDEAQQAKLNLPATTTSRTMISS